MKKYKLIQKAIEDDSWSKLLDNTGLFQKYKTWYHKTFAMNIGTPLLEFLSTKAEWDE